MKRNGNASRIVATNKKAERDYFITETYEAGIVLEGSEVKSIRQGGLNLKDSYVAIRDGETLLIGAHISPYEKGSFFNGDPRRTRKLLLHKAEVNRLRGKSEQKGLTIVPVKAYFKESLVKIEVGLAKGKHTYDVREAETQKDAKREIDRAMKEYNKR